jgi:hypothetical protein
MGDTKMSNHGRELNSTWFWYKVGHNVAFITNIIFFIPLLYLLPQLFTVLSGSSRVQMISATTTMAYTTSIPHMIIPLNLIYWFAEFSIWLMIVGFDMPHYFTTYITYGVIRSMLWNRNSYLKKEKEHTAIGNAKVMDMENIVAKKGFTFQKQKENEE